MPVKKSVRLVDETMKVCRNLTLSGETNWSGSINDMAEQYLLLIDENTPELTDNEWNAFRASFNGYMPSQNSKQEADILWWHISEGYQWDTQVTSFLGSEEKAVQLIERIKGWSTSQRLAVIYKARSYWRTTIIEEENKELDNYKGTDTNE